MIVVLNSGCFGRNLEYLRKRESMSRFRLARLLNLSVLDLFCVEKGNLRDVDFEVLQKISRLFRNRVPNPEAIKAETESADFFEIFLPPHVFFHRMSLL